MTASTTGFAHLLRLYRQRAGLSQEELAERASVSARAVSDMERGLRKQPRPETLRLLADALALDADERTLFFASAHHVPDDSPLSRQQEAPSEKSTAIPLAARPMPHPLDALIGREHDIEAIVSLLASEPVRLVTLTGPGGVGKTRLGLEVASRVNASFSEGAVFVDLAQLTAPDQVGPAMLGAFGLDADPQLSVDEALLNTLRDRSLLLLLDNFEHLLGAAPLLTEVLSGCPWLKILATSRMRLRLRGEQVFQVAPLPVPAETEAAAGAFGTLMGTASVELFVDRARQAKYGFALDEQNARAVADICRRLDGLPLAIELAAARVGMLPPEALLRRLSRLSGGSRDAPDRQQTLRDAIAWSYDLLDPQEQTVFRRLSVLAGGFTLAAAEEVACGDGITAPEAIERLAESSLLVTMSEIETEPRFTMLETVHAYAAELLDQSGEADMIRRRHADWCIALAETAGLDLTECRNVSHWYRRLDAETGNFRSAIDFLLDAGDGSGVVRILSSSASYWIDAPYKREVHQWYRQALPLAGDSPDELTLLGHFQFALVTAMLGDLEQATTYANRFLDWAMTTTSPYALGAAYFTLGVLAEFAGDLEGAVAFHDRAAPLLRETGQPIWILNSNIELGSAELNAGQIEQAVAILDEAVVLARGASAEDVLAPGLTYRGYAALAQDDLALAARLFDEGLTLAQALRMDRLALGAIGGFAGVAIALGRPDHAARLLGAIEAARQSSGIGRITEASLVDEIGAGVLAALGPEQYGELRREGAQMSYVAAIEMARGIAADAGHFSKSADG